ncbi:MAG: tetratricopeptide repeat protein [Thermoanaerobaculia bacterium]
MVSKIKKFIIILVFSVNLFSNEEAFKKGVYLYNEKKYEEALNQWLLLEKDYEDWRIFYNIGNAYAKLGKFGYAMLYYERAYKLNPSEPRIEGNINYLKYKIKDKIEEEQKSPLRKVLEKFYNKLNYKKVLVVLVFSFFLINLIIFFYLIFPQGLPKFILVLLSFFIGLFLISLIFLFHFWHKENRVFYGIVLEDTVEVKSAPMEDSTNLFIVHEGLKVRVNEEVEGWIRITLPNGMSGFIKKESLGII